MASDIPKKSSTKHGEYTGTLAEPIYAPLIGADVADPSGRLKQFIVESAKAKQVAKLKALCEWHEIPWDSGNRWELLATALATAHVPGMRIDQDIEVEHRGRPKKWVSDLGLSDEAKDLLRDVEFLRSNKGLTIEAAIDELCLDKTGQWSSYVTTSLLARHKEAQLTERKQRELATFVSEIDSEASPLKGLYKALCPPFPTDENS